MENSVTRILRATKVSGNITSGQNIFLEGEVHGTIHCKGKLLIKAEGAVIGNVFCDELWLEGKIAGDVEADKAVLKDNCEITGRLFVRQVALSAQTKVGAGLRFKNEKN